MKQAVVLLLSMAALASMPSAAADHGECTDADRDTDGDGTCDRHDPDNDNDGAPDCGDPDPDRYDELDYINYRLKGCAGGSVHVRVLST